MRSRPALAVLVLLLVLAACSEDVGRPTAASPTAAPVASEDEVTPSPTASPSRTPTPSPSPSRNPTPAPSDAAAASPSPSPSSSASPSEPPPSPTPSVRRSEPVLTEAAALAAAQRRQAARGGCDTGIAGEAHRVVATVDQRLLVHVVCLVGAYQPSGELRVWDGQELRAVPVEQWWSGELVDTDEVVGFVTGAPGSNVVTNEVRYRGLGDCGLIQRWTFDGRSLRLDLAREQPCTDDGDVVPPGEWPVVVDR